MRHSKCLVWIVLGCLVFALTAEAAEEKSGSGVGRFFRGIFRFPARTTQKSVEVVTDTAVKGTSIGTGEIENVGEALTGDKEAAVGLVTDPVKGSATMTYDTTTGAVMAPVEGAKEAIADKEHPGHEHPGKEHPEN